MKHLALIQHAGLGLLLAAAPLVGCGAEVGADPLSQSGNLKGGVAASEQRGDDDDAGVDEQPGRGDKDAEKAAEEAAKQAEKAAKEAAKTAEKDAKAAEKAAGDAAKQAEKAAKAAAKDAENAARDAEKDADESVDEDADADQPEEV